MVKSSWRAWLAAAALLLACSSPARAAVIDFEDVTPNIFASGEGFTSGGFNFTYLFDGIGVVDSAVAFFFAAPPPNAAGQFAAALNAGGIAMDAGGAFFRLSGLDLAFLAPLPESANEGDVVGELHLFGLTGLGGFATSLLLPAADADGNFPFASALLDSLTSPLLAVGFRACIYVEQECVFDDNQAQFALDNLRIAFVPETSSLALAVLALAVGGFARRRAR